jgi:hypothetical protein
MKQQLTILGDRQSGRTRTLGLIALADAASGEEVLYEAESWQMAENCFHDIADLAQVLYPDRIEKIRCANGKYLIEFKAIGSEPPLIPGGRIRFASSTRLESRQMAGIRTVTTHIMDDVHAEPHPDAVRVIRAVLR